MSAALVLAAPLLAGLALAAWAWLLLGRGFFWLARERDDRDLPARAPETWPSVAAVVPARDEADVIARSVASLLAQDYPGAFGVIVVDDGSSDGTAAIAGALKGARRAEVVAGAPLPEGWAGKPWAMRQGAERARAADPVPRYLLFTDADIAHAPDNLRRLVARAEDTDLVLVSLMARLSVATRPERALIPAFVFFFAMLYPFAWVNDRRRRTAAAAGGCMLVRREALEAAGGIEAIGGAIIDDCALAALLEPHGGLWLGLTDRATSLRPYAGLGPIGAMISRSAYAQLNYSPGLLAGTVLAMTVIFVSPPLLTVFAHGPARWMAAAAWLAMALAYQPMLRFYGRSPSWGPALPAVALLYTFWTIQSAVQVWSGGGGQWKGRVQARAAR